MATPITQRLRPPPSNPYPETSPEYYDSQYQPQMQPLRRDPQFLQSQYNPAIPARPRDQPPLDQHGWEPEDDYDDSGDNNDNEDEDDDFFNGSPNRATTPIPDHIPQSSHATNSIRASSPPPSGPILDH